MDIGAELKKIRRTFRPDHYSKDVVMQLLEDFKREKINSLVIKYLPTKVRKMKLDTEVVIDELVNLGLERYKNENSDHSRGVEYKGVYFVIRGFHQPFIQLEGETTFYYVDSNYVNLAKFIREFGDNLPIWASEFESLYSENKDKIEKLEILSWGPKYNSEPISIPVMFIHKVNVLDTLYCQNVAQNAKASFIKGLEDAGYLCTVEGNGRVKIEMNHIVVDYALHNYEYSYINVKNNPSLTGIYLSGGTFTLLQKLDDLTPVWLEDIDGKHQTLLKQFKVNDFNSKAIYLLVKTKMNACGYDYIQEKVGDRLKLMIKAKAKRFVSCSFKGDDIQKVEKQLNDICHYVEIINQMASWVNIGVYGKNIYWKTGKEE